MKIELVKDMHFYERVLAIMLPVAMQQAINMGVNMMDTIMLGSFGEVQLSASSLANSFYSIFQIFCMGITAGCSILVSQHYGAGQIKQVKQSFALALRLTAAFGAVFALLTYFFPEQIMRLFSKDPDVIAAGVGYLKITVFIYLIHGIGLVTAQLMRSVGQASLGLYVSIISFVVNVAANWIFIFGKMKRGHARWPLQLFLQGRQAAHHFKQGQRRNSVTAHFLFGCASASSGRAHRQLSRKGSTVPDSCTPEPGCCHGFGIFSRLRENPNRKSHHPPRPELQRRQTKEIHAGTN